LENKDVSPPDVDLPKADTTQRPIDKKSKDALRRSCIDACTEALDILWAKKIEANVEKEMKREERYAKSYALDKERLDPEKEKVEQEREKVSNEANTSYLKRICRRRKNYGH
jgi:thiaminase